MAQAILTPRQHALSRAIKRKIRDAILATPLVADVFLHHWNFFVESARLPRSIFELQRG